jgi:hypothetical protein
VGHQGPESPQHRTSSTRAEDTETPNLDTQDPGLSDWKEEWGMVLRDPQSRPGGVSQQPGIPRRWKRFLHQDLCSCSVEQLFLTPLH